MLAAYRSVPMETLCVLAGIPPWKSKIAERNAIFHWENTILGRLNETASPRNKRQATRSMALGGYDEGLTDEERGWTNPPDMREYEQERREEDEQGNESKAIKRWLRKKAAERTVAVWQEEWTRAAAGRWTFELIPEIKTWTSRKYGSLNFYMTQVLTGHGGFNKFRKRIGKADSDRCWYCPENQDSPEHTVLYCKEWQERGRK